ncbi:uncharacterized protein LOC131646046 [Vicia villosa]|uniref:uncharacterized protein LOC131646046 n=1 Tax=Vicia villosa TaxID=3911 RepID=UPI00273A7FC1|nr:uncharacterized protein LOC131646046 [Vicia villosa]XP_058772201.1 uncharacterized protein LOC131646046 [Vicia villosa]
MAGRNDAALATALMQFAGAIPQMLAGNREGNEFRPLEKFQLNHPPTFEGTHEPDKAQLWLKEIEKIFRVMNCTDAQKVQFGTHKLEKEAEDWWNNTAQRFCDDGTVVTWEIFHEAFLEKYFPEDVRGKKEVEFLELKQGNGTVAVYAAKFEELIKFCPHYNTTNAEKSKCLKFVNGLRPDIKKAISYQQIARFSELVNKSRIYDEDSRDSTAYFKSLNEKGIFVENLMMGKGSRKWVLARN